MSTILPVWYILSLVIYDQKVRFITIVWQFFIGCTTVVQSLFNQSKNPTPFLKPKAVEQPLQRYWLINHQTIVFWFFDYHIFILITQDTHDHRNHIFMIVSTATTYPWPYPLQPHTHGHTHCNHIPITTATTWSWPYPLQPHTHGRTHYNHIPITTATTWSWPFPLQPHDHDHCDDDDHVVTAAMNMWLRWS